MSDEIFIDWARTADTFSDHEVYHDLALEKEEAALRKDKRAPEEHEGGEGIEEGPLHECVDQETLSGDAGPDVGARQPDDVTVGVEDVRGRKPYVVLDPLRPADDPDIIGSFLLKKATLAMRDLGHAFIFAVLAIVTWEASFVAACVPPDPVVREQRPRTDRMHPRNLKEIEDAGLMEDFVPAKLRRSPEAIKRFLQIYAPVRFAALFTVPKANGRHRVVVNGIPGNEILNPPPYFKFFAPWDIVRRLRALGSFYAFTLDIKAWFYRIPMHRRMAAYYTVAPGGRYKAFTCVPMGASVAPAIGQAATMALILYRERQEDDLGVVVPPGAIPAVLDIVRKGEVVGHIFVCLDNIAVVCRERSLKELWEARLERNAKELGIFPFKDEGDNQWTEANFHYIGVHYENGRWRHDADRVARWRKRYGDAAQVRKDLSTRNIQSVTGVLVWDVRLRNDHMKRMRRLFRAQAKIMDEVNPGVLTEEDRDDYACAWES